MAIVLKLSFHEWFDTLSILHETSKTETLDLCQLPRPPYEIHKTINLPASVTIFKNKLKNWEIDKSYFHLPHQANRNNKLIKIPFELPQGFLESDFNSLHACGYNFQIFQYKFNKIWKLRAVNCHINLILHLPHGCLMLWVNLERKIDTCLMLFTICK